MAKGLISQFLGLPEEAQIQEISIEDIEVNPHQPRETFDEDKLHELSNSISEIGLIQPVVVRKRGRKYELVVGERRLRAARLAGKRRIPAIVRHLSSGESIRIALVENLQREDLNPLEEARAYAYLRDNLSMSQQEIARTVGKSQPLVSNVLKLLKLPEEIQKMVADRSLNQGQARALLKLTAPEKQLEYAKRLRDRQIDSIEELEKRLEVELDPDADDAGETAEPQARNPGESARRAFSMTDFQHVLTSFKKQGVEVVSEEREEDDRYITIHATFRVPKPGV